MKIIKNNFYILVCILFFSCSSENQQEIISENEVLIDSLQKENSKLKTKAENSDQTLNDFMTAFNDINNNLQEIKRKEDIISLNAQNMEFGETGTDKIQEDILIIYDLLQENKNTVSNLRSKLEANNMISSAMQKSLNLLSESIERKNNQILSMRETLETMSFEMQFLNASLDSVIEENQQKNNTIKIQNDILNSGYLIIGTSKDLIRKGIITKTGGFIGIGSTSKIDDHFDSTLFTKVNINTTKLISLKKKNVKILSTHPAVAYKFSGPENFYENLIITRPEKFWSTSKYLVIEILE